MIFNKIQSESNIEKNIQISWKKKFLPSLSKIVKNVQYFLQNGYNKFNKCLVPAPFEGIDSKN